MHCIDDTVCPHSLSGRVILPILLKQNPAQFHLTPPEQRLWTPNMAVGSVGSLRLRLPTWSATVRQGQLATSKDLRGVNTLVEKGFGALSQKYHKCQFHPFPRFPRKQFGLEDFGGLKSSTLTIVTISMPS